MKTPKSKIWIRGFYYKNFYLIKLFEDVKNQENIKTTYFAHMQASFASLQGQVGGK